MKLRDRIILNLLDTKWGTGFRDKVLDLCLKSFGFYGYGGFEASGEDRALQFIVNRFGATNLALIDVGANDGRYSQLAHSLGIRSFLLIEPNPALHSLIESWISETKLSFAVLQRFAAGKADEKKSLLFPEKNLELGSLLAVEALQEAGLASGAAWLSTSVQVSTLDSIVANSGIGQAHSGGFIVKIDVEGTEEDVLIGAQNLISSRKLIGVQIEFNQHNLVNGFNVLRAQRYLGPDFTPFQVNPHSRQILQLRHEKDLASNIPAYSNFWFLRNP